MLHRLSLFACVIAIGTFSSSPAGWAKTKVPKTPAPVAETYDGLIEKAIDARRSGDLTTSAELLKKALALEPSAELMNNLGRVLEEDGKYRAAFDTYRTVANDPNADRSLRALDASRMAALQPKIGRAWIVPNITPAEAKVYLDGKAIGATPAGLEGKAGLGAQSGGEHATGPTQTTIEILIPQATEIVIRQPAPPIGERSAYLEDAGAIAVSDARISLEGISPPPSQITIDGQALRGDTSQRTAIRLPAGEHRVGVTLPGFEPEMHLVTLEPKGEVAIAPLLVKKTQVSVESWEPTSAPWITIASGLTVAAVGTGLMGAASMEQASFEDSSGVINTMTQAEAESRNESASILGTAGLVTTIVGAGAAIGGVVWYFIHESNRPAEAPASPEASAWLAPTRGGASAGVVLAW